MKLIKKNEILSTFFLIKDLNPFFYGVVIDSIKNSTGSLIIKNKTLALFLIYLNIFSTKNLNTKKRVNMGNTKANLLYPITKHKLMTNSKVPFNALNHRFNQSLFFDVYLSRYNEKTTLKVLKEIRKIKNFKNI